MKNSILVQRSNKIALLILIMIFGITTTNAHKVSSDYSSLIIIKVTGLNGDSFNKIAKNINKESGLSLEYSCLESDVIVIKYNHTFSEKGDVQHYINNKLKKWTGGSKVEIIHIDMVLSGTSKC